jgi:hypothetical protein
MQGAPGRSSDRGDKGTAWSDAAHGCWWTPTAWRTRSGRGRSARVRSGARSRVRERGQVGAAGPGRFLAGPGSGAGWPGKRPFSLFLNFVLNNSQH